jgi:hypothetical protein
MHHKNSSETSLSRLGLEKAVAPGQTITPPVNDYQTSDLPPIPKASGWSNLSRPLSDQSPGGFDSKNKNIFYSHHNNRIDGISRPPISSKSHSLPEPVSRPTHSPNRRSSRDNSKKVLPPPPPPPMSKSAQKILQLTGFDPSFDEEPKSYYSVSPESSESSGSQYSQPESEPQGYGDIHPRHWAATYTRGEPSAVYLQSSLYNASERSASISDMSFAAVAAASVSATSFRVRDRLAKQGQKGPDLDGEDSTDNLTNEKFMAVEMGRYARQKRNHFDDDFDRDIRSRYQYELTDTDRKELVAEPLTIMPRLEINSKNSRLERHYTNPRSPTGYPYSEMPVYSRISALPAQRPKNERRFGTGKHPVKSQFPFNTQKGPGAREPEQIFRKKVSRAMKRLSGGKIPPVKQTVITNREIEAGGPVTILPSNSRFKSFLPSQDILHKGNEQLQDAVDKARKSLKIKTADEKRREDLKKQIVFVGVTDQSPGMYLLKEYEIG